MGVNGRACKEDCAGDTWGFAPALKLKSRGSRSFSVQNRCNRCRPEPSISVWGSLHFEKKKLTAT